MLEVGFVTLFPEMVLQALGHSILRRAEQAGLVSFSTSDPRDFATDKHRTVDSRPFGGDSGMLLMAEPVAQAIERLLPSAKSPKPDTAVVFPDPTGHLFTQSHASELSRCERVVFVCGHYEGIDDRVRQTFATHVLSLGDFVLTNGEMPALIMADAAVRLLPGVLGSPESLDQDSHSDGLLSAPQFTRPETWRGLAVPEVLRSGDHKKVAEWKRRQALLLTRINRPDLFAKAPLSKKDLELLAPDEA